MQITIKNDQLAKLADAVQAAGRKLPQELATACNKTARGMKVPISQQIRGILVVKAKIVKDVISQSRKATKQHAESAVAIKATARIPLRDFGAKQTKQGVGYKISKQGGRKTAQGAFQGPRPGAVNTKWRGRVFKRIGKSRLPIQQLFGASPWGVFVKNKMDKPTAKEAEQRLEKEIDRRIQYNVFKASELT